MIFKRIFIYGDSFVDNTRINKKSGKVLQKDLPLLWTERIKNYFKPKEYFNYGICATGPSHTVNEIKKVSFSDNDLLIAILSFHDADFKRLFDVNLENQSLIHDLPAKTIVMHVHYDEKLNHPFTFPLSLYDISMNEIYSNSDKVKNRRWDKRINHLSWNNHDILFECIIRMIKGDNNFSYDMFNSKFLSVDQAYHSDLYNSDTEFIYD